MSRITDQIVEMSSGIVSSRDIASTLNVSARYVRRVRTKLNLPRPSVGAPCGEKNPSYVSGRIIDLDGYALVSSPLGHPNARKRKDRNYGHVLEHRLIAEKHIGRYLLKTEVVDHIDGLRLHNHETNLRIFQSNGKHLQATIKGAPKRWSTKGLQNIGTRSDLGIKFQPVDTYHLRKKRGDVRLMQILLASLRFDIESPFLLGTTRYIEERGIDPRSRTSLKHALKKLYLAWERDLLT